jgi:hypothetical protein
MTPSIAMLCFYAECHYDECQILFTIMLNVIKLSVIMLSVIMLSVIMLIVIMLSVVMMSIVVPGKWLLDFVTTWCCTIRLGGHFNLDKSEKVEPEAK